MKKICMIIFTFILFFTNLPVKAEFERVYNSEDLSDYFSTMKSCDSEGGSSDCKNGNEYKFYVKMYDLYYLYQNKYNVKLDLPLIMAALYYGNEELPVVFTKNLNDYNRADLKNDSIVTNLDWEYDYKNDDCYTYLNANDFRYDMQILAKNMVKKEITYSCKSDDNSSNESKKAEDIEKSNYSDNTLKCDKGKYDPDSIKETYTYDADKYKKFLLEYIKLKYHTKGSPVKNCVTQNNNSSSSSSSSYTDIPVTKTGKEAIDKMNQIALNEAKTAAPREKYYKWNGTYGIDWCALFVSWLFDQINGIGKYYYVTLAAGPSARQPIASGFGQWLEDECTDPSTVPRPGDVLHWKKADPAYYVDRYSSKHVGYVYAVDDKKIYTVEGNHDPYKVVTVEHDRKDCNINGYYRANF